MYFIGAVIALTVGVSILKRHNEIKDKANMVDQDACNLLAYLGSALVAGASWLYSLGLNLF